ncbi:unannotated protein [freshwater metagenome]|uniref:Unannotated protein n=1 Tax=freshwater metagenome TaxID=449393 RepID=A0A6J6AXR4_9ZZZZ
MMAPRTAIATTVTPAYPKDFKNMSGKNINEASVIMTVIPEKNTVRPAVFTVIATDSSTLRP